MDMSALEDRLTSIGNRISNQRFLSSIKDAFMMTLPIPFIGSISLLISNPPILETTENAFLLGIKEFTLNNPFLAIPYNLTTGIFGLWIALAVAFCHARKLRIDQFTSVIIAGVSFLSISSIPEGGLLPMNDLGARGIFSGMIVALFCVEMYAFLLKKNIRIKLPDSVPPMISASFNSIISFLICLSLVIGLNQFLISAFDTNFTNLVFSLFRPLVLSSDTLIACIVAVLLTRLLWFFGVHGGAVTNAVLSPILISNMAANQEAYNAGIELPHVLTQVITQGSFWGLSFFPAAIIMIFACKSSHLKSIGKLGIIPSFLGIGEPINFGTPFVLNFTLAIPGIILPVFNSSIAFLAMKYGFINRAFVTPPLGTPGPLAVYIASLDWRAMVLWVVLVVLNCIVLLPFFKAYDRQLLQEENVEKEMVQTEAEAG